VVSQSALCICSAVCWSAGLLVCSCEGGGGSHALMTDAAAVVDELAVQ